MAICALEKHFPTVMHVQHKAGTSDEQGQRVKAILKDLQPEKFLKYLDFMMDVTKILSTLSKTFQSDKLCVTDIFTTLETTPPLWHSYIKGPQYKKFKVLLWRHRYSSGGTTELLKVIDPREMLLEHSYLATYGNRDVKSLVEHFSNNYLTEEEETNIISMWPALHTRLVSQKAISLNDVFSNLLASRPDDNKDCLILLDLMLTSTPSTAKCNLGFSVMNHLKCNLRTILGQNTLSDLMQMRSSHHAMKAYRPNSASNNWFSGAKTKRHILKIIIQINYRNSQTVSKFSDDVHFRNLIHASSTN